MAYAQSPNGGARARYNASFNSTIFAPSQQPSGPAYVPAGKRRDQSTSELFGSYDEKDLRSCPKTFEPKDDMCNARQKKQHFLSSDVLPRSQYHAAFAEDMPYPSERGDEEDIDPNVRRQMELSSQLFGRETPASTMEQLHDRSTRLTPNDFSWHSYPQDRRNAGPGDVVSHSARAYQEKCSSVFDYKSPMKGDAYGRNYAESDRLAKEDNDLADSKRRSNAQFSDLFGRETPMDAPDSNQDGTFRPKSHGSREDKITIHGDWTDSKTEVMGASRTNRPEHPLLRKSDELHQNRIFGERGAWQASVDRPDAMTYDNSQKVKPMGHNPQDMHQAHLRTSMTPNAFYAEAANTKHWEVVELHVSGLDRDTDDQRLKRLCQGCDLHIVKVAVDMDPVRNLCKGRAKVMVRYNPERDSVAGLARKLEEQQLKVEV